MLAALNRDGVFVPGYDVIRTDGPFYCPECHARVIFHNGHILIRHFAHYPDASCRYGADETLDDLRAKLGIYRALDGHPSVIARHLEYKIGGLRTDLFVDIRGKWVAIEVQFCELSVEAVRQRIAHFTAHGVHTLYLVLPPPKPWYFASPMDTYLNQMYRQNLYSWYEDDKISIYHLENGLPLSSQTCAWDRPYVQCWVDEFDKPISITRFAPDVRRPEADDKGRLCVDRAMLWQQKFGEWWKGEGLDNRKLPPIKPYGS